MHGRSAPAATPPGLARPGSQRWTGRGGIRPRIASSLQEASATPPSASQPNVSRRQRRCRCVHSRRRERVQAEQAAQAGKQIEACASCRSHEQRAHRTRHRLPLSRACPEIPSLSQLERRRYERGRPFTSFVHRLEHRRRRSRSLLEAPGLSPFLRPPSSFPFVAACQFPVPPSGHSLISGPKCDNGHLHTLRVDTHIIDRDEPMNRSRDDARQPRPIRERADVTSE